MDQNIKNRLVGIIVIFALAVIFLPMILDGSGVHKDKIEVSIPQQPLVDPNPDFETRIIELNANIDAMPDVEPRFIDETSPDIPSDNKVKRITPPVSEIQADAEPLQPADDSNKQATREPVQAVRTGGESWVLQVGSFQDRGKALAQRDKIRKSNIAAVFIEQYNVDNKSSFRVRVGPFLSRDQTQVAQNKIKAKHDIDGIIMKYER
jgi:DedD protein